MRTTIIYASKYGTTATIAKEIADLISTHDQVQVLDINKIKEVTISDLLNPDRFVLGVPIYAGKPLQAMQNSAKPPPANSWRNRSISLSAARKSRPKSNRPR